VRLIDYDRIDEWGPWFEEMILSIGGADLQARVRQAQPENLGDARDQIVQEVGRSRLVDHLNNRLAPYGIRVFHGTRVTTEEALQIQAEGLKALRLIDRRAALAAIFGQHAEWPLKQGSLDGQLHRFGSGWATGGGGRREDGSVHFCLSRAGILYGCNHYLTHGAEVDQHIAQALFPDGSGLELLRRNRTAKLISFVAPFPEAAVAANPYGFPEHGLPALMSKLLSAWAYRLTHPEFSPANERDGAALKFNAPIAPERLERIEGINDDELIEQ
jgi:hypothetical protein